MKENKTAFAILGLLSHEDMTGYDIKKRVEASLAFFWSVGFGQIYPALAQLEEQGFVTKRLDLGGRGPKRIVYSITEAGRGGLRRWLAEPAEKEEVRYEILLKLFFASQTPPTESIGVIESFRDRNAAGLETLRQFHRQLEGVLEDSDDHLYYCLTVLFGEKVYQAYLEWAGEAIEMLRNKEKDQ